MVHLWNWLNYTLSHQHVQMTLESRQMKKVRVSALKMHVRNVNKVNSLSCESIFLASKDKKA